jgi:LmbE family N-acetylglucosaminyl deacetylase
MSALQSSGEHDITNPKMPAVFSRIVICAGLTVLYASAQPPYFSSIDPVVTDQEIAANQGSAALWQSLKKLHTRASLIMVTAHPDDEDGGMLTYESRGRGTRVALLTLNRGEGGANVMSNDYFDALALVRTMELLQAGRYYGVDQYWTRVIDYGFSKTKAESIARWTHDRVLADVVRVVRAVRPLVITSVFVGGPSDGHGNHQTAGAMAQEAFKAAAEPNMFPEQIRSGRRPGAPRTCVPPGWRGGARRRRSTSRFHRALTTPCWGHPTRRSARRPQFQNPERARRARAGR